MGCGKSANKADIKNNQVYQPQEVDQSKLKYQEKPAQNNDQIFQEQLITPKKEHSMPQMNHKNNQQPTINSGYFPNGKVNRTFGKQDKFQNKINKFLYFFGVNQINEQQILKFDVENKQFYNLYQDLSQEQKENVSIYNYTLCLQIDDENIFICGGINQELTEIQNETYIFNIKTLQFQKQQDLVTSRYTHFGLIHQRKVYCIGGRSYGDDQQAILRSCEVFDLDQKSWSFHPPLNVARCTGMVFLYNEHDMYVAGGYSGPEYRTKKIEKFNLSTNQWDILDFKLHRGLEGSFYIASNIYNELLIFGGYCKGGATSSICSIDMQEQSIRFKGKMAKQRVLHKSVQSGDNLYIFGGDEANHVEKIDLYTFKTQIISVKNNFTDFCDQFEIEKYSASLQTQQIDYFSTNSKKNPQSLQNNLYEEEEKKKEHNSIYHLLGTEEQPFIIQFKGTSEQDIKVKSVPTNLDLSCYQGGCRLSQNEIFLAGGISSSMNQVLQKCFIYNFEKKVKTKMPPMIHQRYAFSCLYVQEQNEIYVIGGRSYNSFEQDDNHSFGDTSQDQILSKLQQYDSQIYNNNKESMQNSQLTNKNQQQSTHIKNSQAMNNRSNYTQNKNQSQLNENVSLLPQNQGDVLAYCEKFDLKTKKWVSIQQMNRPRSSACSFIYFNKIYIYGGYHGSDIYKQINMESYDSKNNKWEEHNIQLDKQIPSLEASQIIQDPSNQNSFLIFGGQVGSQPSNSVWEFDILNLCQKEISHMKYPRYLHKIVKIQDQQSNSKIAIIGGNQSSMIEFYEQNNQNNTNDEEIVNHMTNIFENTIGDKIMKKYLLI
ncbi:kelch motif protein (macronuclear) [Tetrahymena thermophila SB210]|uniref:Kelch motif protein n=1 Tax=Tetrahymena thermophila (strain SB210) TaxID=312017 RepID=Q23RG5_TETTS|nr:kelch motif protein [Tetrahymena thermophila SB210]EAR99083.1 kelch motif protein [Tetrahymena thermophila SB210]|eukprot:XP_001019328.1 kelch motif protein [Tetrahymena thermophila SB210]